MSQKATPGKCDTTTVVFPRHVFDDPKDLLIFIEFPGFTRDWERLGLDDEDDLSALQIAIMLDPKRSPVIAGTGGLRKLRFSPPKWNKGKRGALRVCYVYFEDLGIVLLVIVYSKSDQDDLSGRAKKIIKGEIEQQHRLLSDGFFK